MRLTICALFTLAVLLLMPTPQTVIPLVAGLLVLVVVK
jgi:hypothetical protein